MALARPLWALGILIFMGAGALALARTRPRVPGAHAARPWPCTVLLCLSGALLSVALASPSARSPKGPQNVALVVDVSASLSPRDIQQELDFVNSSAADMAPGDRASVICFAREPCTEVPLGPKPPALREFESRPVPAETRIDRALDAAQEALQGCGSGRVVLVSDGNQTSGSAEEAASRLRQAGLVLDTLLVGSAVPDDLAVERLQAPSACELGRPVPLVAWVRTSQAREAAVVLRCNSDEVLRGTVALEPGLNEVRLEQRATAAGVARFEFEVEPESGKEPGNNRAWAATFVTGPPSALLVSTGRSRAAAGSLAELLSRMGYSVRVVGSSALPSSDGIAGFALVVLHDVSAAELGKTGMAAIRTSVEEHGTGLVVTGGPNSFTLGGYSDTELEQVLPVTAEIREKLEFPSVAIVLVIDKSGSMGARAGVSKLDMAKEAAVSVMELMGEKDLLGVLAFDVEPRWVVPVSNLTQREALAARMTGMLAGGGTNLYPALVEARRALAEATARSKLTIVLSDGVSREADFKDIVTGMAKDGMTVTTVSIGADSDVALMSDIARWGNGRAYYTQDIFSVPRIFASEALLLQRPAAATGTFPCKVAARVGPLDNLAGSPPPVRGYAATTARPTATVHLASPSGDPILASRWAGVGRCVAFTSTAFGEWDPAWRSWTGSEAFWTQVMRWASRAAQPERLRTTVDLDAETLSLVVDAIDPDGQFADGLLLDARITTPDARTRTARVRQTAPGRYEASIPVAGQGCFLVSISETPPAGPGLPGGAGSNAKPSSTVNLALASPPPLELVRPGPDPELMRRLAAIGGGRTLAPGDRISRRDRQPGRVDATAPFVVAALLALVAAAASRRLAFGRRGIRETMAWVWGSVAATVAALAATVIRRVPATIAAPAGGRPRHMAAAGRLEQLRTLDEERRMLEQSPGADPVKLYFARVRRDVLARELARELQEVASRTRRQGAGSETEP